MEDVYKCARITTGIRGWIYEEVKRERETRTERRKGKVEL